MKQLFPVLVSLLGTTAVAQEPGTVQAHQEISAIAGGLVGPLTHQGRFGTSVAALGDFDADGVGDIVVGAGHDDDGGTARGAVWILLLKPDGTVKAERKINSTHGNFQGPLRNFDHFGQSVCALGDLDGDGVTDLAVGASGDDDGSVPMCTIDNGCSTGAVWILFMNADGTVRAQQKISALQGGFTGQLDELDGLGAALAPLGDFDGDGVCDLAVGAPGDDDSTLGLSPGAVWLLFLNTNGTVASHQKISDTAGGFTGGLHNDAFGLSIACLGDLDADGVKDLVVGAPLTRAVFGAFFGAGHGAVWILFLHPNGTVKAHHEISQVTGDLASCVSEDDNFGWSATALGDIDGDGVTDIAVGAQRADDELTLPTSCVADQHQLVGEVWVLFMNTDGSVKGEQKINRSLGGFTGGIDLFDRFGSGVATPGDLDDDGIPDLVVGAREDDGPGPGFSENFGAAWVLFLNGVAPASASPYGCGLNPPGSLVVLAGQPALGTAMTLGVDNPLGTQAAGAVPFLGFSFAPDPGFPCGTPIPGLGMAGPGASGELLLDLMSPSFFPQVFVGAPWAGPGAPSPFPLSVPSSSALLGLEVFAQGLLLDPTAVLGVRFGLTEAVRLRIGP